MNAPRPAVFARLLNPPRIAGAASVPPKSATADARDGRDGRAQLSRRRFVASAGLGLAALAAGPRRALAETSSNELATAFDAEIETFMSARKIPGGALAVIKDGRLVYARGYGWADRDNRVPARPGTLFRIASISKPVTAVAVLRLVEEGRLDLESPVFARLGIPPLPGQRRDPRLERVTVRELLQHTGGWDRDKSFDPMFRSRAIARALNVFMPPGAQEIIRYMFGRKLDFDPGLRYAYSNFGYAVLGRLIEQVTGLPYESFVRDRILAPAGLGGMRLGKSLDGQQAKGESRYYMPHGGMASSVFLNTAAKVPWPYGGFCLEAMDAHGGWLASAVDLARFAATFDDATPTRLLKLETVRLLESPPPPPVARKPDGSLNDWFYGLGWAVRPVSADGRPNCWHTGSLPGTSSVLVRRHDGLGWAVIFNQRSEDSKLPDAAIDAALHRAANRVTDWPAHNLFDRPLSPP